MALFGWGASKEKAAGPTPLDSSIGDIFDPAGVLRALDQMVPRYLDGVDRHEFIYPACKRTPADAHGGVRAIWEHTRLEALRYLVMVPGRDAELLVAPARQPAMMEAFLRQQPHENTVIDFTGVATENIGTAIIAGFNWLNHGASLAGVQREKVARTLTSFRKVVRLAQQWWETEGAEQRCQQMLAERERPPLMLYLVWSDYTRLAKEIAIAAPMRAPETDRETMNRLAAAQAPEDLEPTQPTSG
jgi:hypothetical protein